MWCYNSRKYTRNQVRDQVEHGSLTLHLVVIIALRVTSTRYNRREGKRGILNGSFREKVSTYQVLNKVCLGYDDAAKCYAERKECWEKPVDLEIVSQLGYLCCPENLPMASYTMAEGHHGERQSMVRLSPADNCILSYVHLAVHADFQ